MKKTILMTAVMLLAFSVAASAQALYQVGSTPVTTVASCGTTELTGAITLAEAVGTLPTVPGTITITYGVAITSITNLTITVNGTPDPTGVFVKNTSAPADLAAGRLVLTVTPGATNITSIIVNGVRVNIAGNPGLTSLTAQLTATGNSFVGGQTSVVVISSIASAILSVAGNTPSLVLSALAPGINTLTVTATEGFVNAWVQGSIVGFTFSAVPAGIQLSAFPLTVGPDAQGTIWQMVTDATGGTASATSPVLTSTNNPTVYYKVATAVPAAADIAVETLPIGITVSAQPAAALPLSPGTLNNVTVDMFPRAPATIPPVYAGTTCQKVSAGTLITIVPATTNLLIPYATTLAGYDTGIAIANVTKDPFALTPVTAQSGTITFYLFPAGGTMFSITPTANGGLTNGVLASGSEYVYLLSGLLADAGKPAAFSGYIYVVCNFTNSHGQYFISNFEAFTNGSLMLVSQVPRIQGFESLGQ